MRLTCIRLLVRPPTLIAIFVASAGMAWIYGFDWLPALLYGAIAVLGQAIGQTVNHMTDIDIDRINKPYRPLVSGLCSFSLAKALLAALLTMQAALFAVLFAVASKPLLAAGVFYGVSVFLAVGYNWWPRAKCRFPVDLAWQAAARGALPPLLLYYLSGNRALLGLAAVGYVYVFSFQASKDVPDYPGDLAYGCRTLATVLGPRRARLAMFSLGVANAAVLYSGGLPLTGLLFAVVALAVLRGDRRLDGLENDAGWVAFYLGYALLPYFYALDASWATVL